MLSIICVLTFRMSFILSDMTACSSASCKEIVSLSVVWTYVILGIWSAPTNFIQSRLHLVIINLAVKILTNSNNLFGNPLHLTIFLLRKCIPARIKTWRSCSQGIDCFPLSQAKVGSFWFSAPVRRTGCGGLLVNTDCVRRRWRWSVLLCATSDFVSTFSWLKTLHEFPEKPVF